MGIGNILRFIKQEVGLYPTLFSLVMITKVLGFSTIPNSVIVCNVALVIVFITLLFKNPFFDMFSLAFLVWIPFTLLINVPPELFRSWERYALFSFVFTAVGPLIKSSLSARFRYGTLICSFWLFTFIAIGSFFGYFLGINYMRNFEGELLGTSISSTFGGLTTHSMLLGPISGLAALYMIYNALKTKKIIYWFSAIPCMGSLLFASSRSAFYGFLIGGVVIIYFSSTSNSLFRKRAAIIAICGALTFPLWNYALRGMQSKEKIALEYRQNSRSNKWEARMTEFKESPLTGYGFCAVDLRHDAVGAGGIIEPGSSWLAVLSMTGIVGFLLFCIIYLRAVKKLSSIKTPKGGLLAGSNAMMGVHMLAEGYVFAGGSYLCFIVWLLIGSANDLNPKDGKVKV